MAARIGRTTATMLSTAAMAVWIHEMIGFAMPAVVIVEAERTPTVAV